MKDKSSGKLGGFYFLEAGKVEVVQDNQTKATLQVSIVRRITLLISELFSSPKLTFAILQQEGCYFAATSFLTGPEVTCEVSIPCPEGGLPFPATIYMIEGDEIEAILKEAPNLRARFASLAKMGLHHYAVDVSF